MTSPREELGYTSPEHAAPKTLAAIELTDMQRRVLKRIAAGRSAGVTCAEIFALDDLKKLGLVFRLSNGKHDTTKGPAGGEALLAQIRIKERAR